MYGRDPPALLRYEQGSTENTDLEEQLLERDTMLVEVKKHLVHAQQLMKNNTDKHRRDVEFEVGTLVYLTLRPYRQQSVARRVCQKLSANILVLIGLKKGLVRQRIDCGYLLLRGFTRSFTFHSSRLLLGKNTSCYLFLM